MKKIFFKNGMVDLAQSRLGTKIVYKTDEFFAPAKRIINPWPPVFKEGVFDKHGKWMDGWETRRKRSKGHDYLILKLGKPGKIHKVDIDTSYFSGNQPRKVSLEACFSKKKLPNKNSKWVKILNKKSTKPNSHHFFIIKSKFTFTHVKLNIYPDGGVARLRIYGSMEIKKKFGKKIINLTSVLNGATPIACNNEHFGRAENILAPGTGKNMGDGWETRRIRGKNFDWLILKCATAGKIGKIQIDTDLPYRKSGCAALDMAYVASGRYDGYFQNDLNLWDIAAGIILVKEAGGILNEIDLSVNKNIKVIASSADINSKLLEKLSNF